MLLLRSTEFSIEPKALPPVDHAFPGRQAFGQKLTQLDIRLFLFQNLKPLIRDAEQDHICRVIYFATSWTSAGISLRTLRFSISLSETSKYIRFLYCLRMLISLIVQRSWNRLFVWNDSIKIRLNINLWIVTKTANIITDMLSSKNAWLSWIGWRPKHVSLGIRASSFRTVEGSDIFTEMLRDDKLLLLWHLYLQCNV